MQNNNKHLSTNTKKGAASLYVVIFTTLLLGIITLGFIRIMLSETIQTNNADLSQSAHDSALAGVEDAKVAILKYHECLSSNSTSQSCENAKEVMRDGNSTTNCDIVREILYDRKAGDEHETIIESGNNTGAEMEQAYTCVLISEDNEDYLGQLNANYHSKIVPIRTTDVNAVEYVRIDWYSNTNAASIQPNTEKPTSNLKTTNKPSGYDDSSNTGLFSMPADPSKPYAPPTLGVQLIQTDKEFRLDQLDHNNGDKTDRGTLLLYPDSTAPSNIVESNSGTGFSAAADKAMNVPTAIKCQENNSSDTAYYCSATMAIPKPYNNSGRNDASVFLRVFLPYGTPDTDFSVTLCNDRDCKSNMPFIGVQARIDATGRANDLFRRVESRIELVDVYFPFPEYSATLKGNGETLNKNYWVTYNNWNSVDSAYIN